MGKAGWPGQRAWVAIPSGGHWCHRAGPSGTSWDLPRGSPRTGDGDDGGGWGNNDDGRRRIFLKDDFRIAKAKVGNSGTVPFSTHDLTWEVAKMCLLHVIMDVLKPL